MRAASAGALALLLLGVLASARDSAFRAERRGARTGSSQQTLGPVEGIAKAIAGVAAVSNLPLILGTVKRKKSLLILPVVAAGGWGVWRAIAAYKRDGRYD